MYIDIVDILRLQTSVLECVLHHENSTESLGVRSCDVMCVGTHALAHHLGIDLCATSLSVLEFLKDEASSTLAHDESVARCAERT